MCLPAGLPANSQLPHAASQWTMWRLCSQCIVALCSSHKLLSKLMWCRATPRADSTERAASGDMQRIQGLTGPSLMVRLNSVHYVQEHVPQLLQIVQDRWVLCGHDSPLQFVSIGIQLMAHECARCLRGWQHGGVHDIIRSSRQEACMQLSSASMLAPAAASTSNKAQTSAGGMVGPALQLMLRPALMQPSSVWGTASSACSATSQPLCRASSPLPAPR